MSDQPDESEKTEEPSEKKLSDALKKGDVAKSQEISTWFVLVAGAFILVFSAGPMAHHLSVPLAQFLIRPQELIPLVEEDRGFFGGVLFMILRAMWLPIVLLMAAGIAGNLIQHPPILSAERMKPQWSKLSPMKGFKRIFGLQAWVNFAKSVAKLILVGSVVMFVVWPQRALLADLIDRDLVSFLPLLRALSLKLLSSVLAVFTVIALADFVYQKFEHRKRQRMTKQEVRDEFKQMDGDPTVKAKLRQLRMERGRSRMMAAVPKASVVITNPTHFAVALQYVHGETNAPVCLAKGQDLVALKIREVAQEHNIPIVENPPLARALFQSVDIDQEIAPDHYKAVAEVISYVLRLKKRK